MTDRYNAATVTGLALQDDETFKSEGGFIPERDQYYFQMQQGENPFLVGFKDILICIRLLEKISFVNRIFAGDFFRGAKEEQFIMKMREINGLV